MLVDLCRRHSSLEEEDIQLLEQISKSLDCLSDLLESDVFIDCETQDPDIAIVVAQAWPSHGDSLYLSPVVGKFAQRSKEPAVIRTLQIGMPTMDMLGITQENRNVRQSVSPIKNRRGKVIGALIAEKDITESIKAEKKLSVLTQTTEQLIGRGDSLKSPAGSLPYHVTDGVLMFNDSGVCTYANPVAEKIYANLGYIEPLEGLSFANITFCGAELQDVFEKKQLNLNDIAVGAYNFNVKYTCIESRDERPSGVVMLVNDVTEMKNKEKELVLKKVAISEIHHRVKNNLQTIASLLRLQAGRVEQEQARAAFKKSINQVLSIAATHEILAEDGSDDIDIMLMLKKIRINTLQGLPGNKKISINLNGDSFMCNSDLATSIALVVNEVMQNSLKYAFVGRDQGRIDIEICKGKVFSNISIIDDGVGFDLKDKAQNNLGLKLVQRIVTEKLRGNMNMQSNDQGTKFLFDFSTGGAGMLM